MCNPRQVYAVSQGKSGMIDVFRLERQVLPGCSKFELTGIGNDREVKKVLHPIISAASLGIVSAELIGCFNLIFYSSAEDAVFKALSVE